VSKLKDVTEASFNDIITPARIQFIIPIWQRTYNWEPQQWRDLWEDIMDLNEKLRNGETAQHFMGPIVLKTQEQKVGGITKLVLIDGQQRLTTLLLICALIRDRAKDNPSLITEIESDFLFNAHAKRSEDKPKLCPTEADAKYFDLIMTGKPLPEGDYSQLHAAYDFFESAFEHDAARFDFDGLLDCIRGLRMVTIRLEESDNPNRIFETLNFRGKELAQSDLVRNFFMMSIREPSKVDEIYKQVWFPMQQNLGRNTLERIENLETFLRHYVVMRDQGFIKEDETYSKIRNPLKNSTEAQIVSELSSVSEYSKFYEKLLYPDRESNLNIKKGIDSLNRLKIGVHYPFLLKVYKAFAVGTVTEENFCAILKTIESYIIRRFFSKLPTHSLNRLFAELCKLPKVDMDTALTKSLEEKGNWTAQYWPKDKEFKEQFHTLPLYKMSLDRCRFVLETLEEDFQHPEPVVFDNLWIEHIMPNTLDTNWQTYLGENWKSIHDNYVHTIGNLTLIAASPNESIQNGSFLDKKKDWYSLSNISLTKEINQKWAEWKMPEIVERANLLADRAIRIWPRPEEK
jgi:uncharacterized protein with ParB-like and HNH nuclease domain